MQCLPYNEQVFRTRLARHPNRITIHPLLIEDWLELADNGKAQSVHKMIDMVRDLQHSGRNSRFVKHLGGAVYELKTRTPQGGARVYFFQTDEHEFVLTRSEVKLENQASLRLLEDTAEIIEALEQGKDILE
jgi:phage-related protein